MRTPAAEPTLPRATLRAVEETLRTFSRAYRAYQLYLPNNPMRQKALDDAKQAFADLWPHLSSVSMTIVEAAFLVDGQEVYHDEERGASGLPWLLYRDGLRRLDIAQGFEETELEVFLEILHRSKTAPPDEDDLVTLLWVADLKFLQYRNVELMIDFDTVYAEGEQEDEGDDASALTGAQLVESMPPGEGAPPEFIVPEDFESSLYFLDAGEIAHLQEEVRREYETDGRIQVIAALFDIIEGQDEVASQLEATDIIDQLVVEALAEGEYSVAATILREARATLSRRDNFDPTVHAALASLPVRLSEAEVISQLLQAIDHIEQGSLAPILDDLFAELKPWAMIPLLSWYGVAPPSPARHAIERAIVRVASRNTAELVRQLDHEDGAVVRGAVRIARVVPSTPLVTPLARLLSSGDVTMRVDVVAALAAVGSPGALKALEGAIDDDLRDVRVAALKAISAHRHAAALPRLQGILQKKSMRSADLSEKMAFFEAFGAVCGDAGVPLLDSLLNGRGLLGHKESPEMRACAAHALGKVASPAALGTLEKASNAQDVVVRSAVSRALRGTA